MGHCGGNVARFLKLWTVLNISELIIPCADWSGLCRAMCKIVSTRLVQNGTLPLADTKKKGGAYTYNNEV